MEQHAAEAVKDAVTQPADMMSRLLDWAEHFLMTRGLDFLAAVVIAVIGYFIARWVRHVVRNMMNRSQIDQSAAGFVAEMVYFLILIIVLVAALSAVGLSTTSLSAAVGGVGLAIGLAMKDNFSNVASGIFILIFKPFRSGDFIEVAGQSGTVIDILTMYTRLRTMGNQLIVIPNSQINAAVVKNYSHFDTRNVEFNLSVGYDTDLARCLSLLSKLFKEDPNVLNKEDFPMYIKEMAESSINIYISLSVWRKDYFKVRDELYIKMKTALDEAGIDIPFPQVVVHQAGK